MPGPVAPRQFIEVLAGSNPEPFKTGSGRLELARAIANKENPLTARVWVNRVWKNLFGEAIVRTPSDFGVRSDKPTHPGMLDWLASDFMSHDWSSKHLVRTIVLSSTYRQDSKSTDKGMLVDPSNESLWRMNVRRLPFEAIRDTLLVVGGNMDFSMGGIPIMIDSNDATRANARRLYNIEVKLPEAPRRTVYGMVDRGALPEMFRTFDFSNPDMSTGERIQTTVPQQALFMMNSPFVAQQVQKLLNRPELESAATPEEKVQRLFSIAFQRPATEQEVQMSLDFLSTQLLDENPPGAEPNQKIDLEKLKNMNKDERRAAYAKMQAEQKNSDKLLDAWERYAQVVLLSNELIFVN